MKQRLILLSDLWGAGKAKWVKRYEEALSKNYDFHFYDACQLGEIDISDYDESSLHQQFVTGGIDRAAHNLLKLETSPTLVLGFSVGGLIGWKAIVAGLPAQELITVSSTRLRYEAGVPACPYELYFGAEDPYLPSQEWLHSKGRQYHLIEKQGHELYKNECFAQKLIGRLSV